MKKSEIIFITVGTPTEERIKDRDRYLSRANLVYVSKVAKEIAMHLNGPKIIVDKSTVPIRTGEKVKETIERYSKRSDFFVVSNPEFLREGYAVQDCLEPDRIVIGTNDEIAFKKMRELYKKYKDRIIETNIWSAELGKLAANGFLAMSISYANILARLCDRTGADVTEVAEIMRTDKRIGRKAFLSAGIGFGGSCFPKDVRALYSIFKENGIDAGLLKEIMVVNDTQIEYFVERMRDEVWTVNDKTFSILGLAFKENTDDVRESRSIEIVKELVKMGAQRINVYDNHALEKAKQELAAHGKRDGINYNERVVYCEKAEECYTDSDVLIIGNEDPDFKKINPSELKKKMTKGNAKRPAWVFEGRHTFNPKEMIKNDFIFYSIGRPFKK